MKQPHHTAPERVKIEYRQHKKTGLLCAYSHDLDGLVVFGRTLEQLQNKVPLAVTELVKAQTGDKGQCYDWFDDSDDDQEFAGFVGLGQLVAVAHANC